MRLGLSLAVTRLRAAGVGGGGGSVVTDTFTRADSAVSLGSTEGGTAGVLVWQVDQGTWGVQSNRAYNISTAANDRIYIASGVSDCTVTEVVGVAGGFGGILFRRTDASNYWRVYWDATTIYLDKVVAGVASNVSAAQVVANGDIVSVVLSGVNIVVKLNGVTIAALTRSDAFSQTGTGHGLYLGAGSAVPRWDSFTVTVP